MMVRFWGPSTRTHYGTGSSRERPHDGGKDMFVHISAVERAGLSGLAEGQKVSYEEQTDPKRGKTAAENLKVV